MRTNLTTGLGALLVGVFFWSGCQDKYERLPAATDREFEALSERYQALIDEATKLKDGDPLALLHHFSNATLTMIQPDAFRAKAAKFISDAASGKLTNVKIRGARSPGKVRLLLVSTPEGNVAIPLVQS